MPVKLVVIYPPPQDVQAFETVYKHEHVPMATEKLAGKTKIIASRVLGSPQGKPAVHRIAEIHFPSIEALQACAESEGGANLFGLLHDEILRHVVGAEDERKDFDRRFKFFRHDVVYTQLVQFLQLAQIARPNHDMNVLVQATSHLHCSAGHERIGDRNDQDPCIFDLYVPQYIGVCGIPIIERQTVGRFSSHGIPVQIQRDIGHLRLTQYTGQIASVEPISHDNHMVLDA